MWATCGPAGGRTFLSTLSLRRATGHRPNCNSFDTYFYPRSPCGERRPRCYDHRQDMGNFYPRSPCGERLRQCRYRVPDYGFLSTLSLRRATLRFLSMRFSPILFLSTLSLRRATNAIRKRQIIPIISIHALLAESDGCQRPYERPTRDFYPRSPCGERPRNGLAMRWNTCISIHALLAESDMMD